MRWLALALPLLSAPAAWAPAAWAQGGTLVMLSRSAAGTIDPQVNYTAQFWQVFGAAYDGLVAFRRVAGPDGRRIVPDLAEAVPEPERGGLLWRFRLRPGVRFSDGRAVRAEDVVASFRRLFRVGSPTGETFYGAILGAEACLRAPDTCRLEGVRIEDGAVVIELVRPDGELLQKLALPHASVLPADAPGRDVGTAPIAGTGPYRIVRYDPNDGLVLERNPYFREWSADAQPAGRPDAISYRFGLEAGAQVSAVLGGQADWMFDTPPPDRLGEVATRPEQVHLNPAHAVWMLPLNTRLPPFDDVRVRRALDLALDRRAAVRLFGGRRLAEALCGVVPPGLPGHRADCPAPDLLAARRLMAEAGAAGQAVALVVDDAAVSRALGTYVVEVMGDLGLRARLVVLSANVQFTYIQNTANRVQASLTSWYADYPSAANILAGNFGCGAFRQGSDSSTNIAGFCDAALDARLQAALAAGDAAGVAAGVAAVAGAIDAEVPAVALFSPRYIDVVSTRVRGFVYHDTFRFLPSQAVLE